MLDPSFIVSLSNGLCYFLLTRFSPFSHCAGDMEYGEHQLCRELLAMDPKGSQESGVEGLGSMRCPGDWWGQEAKLAMLALMPTLYLQFPTFVFAT